MIRDLVVLALFAEINVYVCAGLSNLVVHDRWRPHHLLFQSVDCILISDCCAQDLVRLLPARVLLVYMGEVLASLQRPHLNQVLAYVRLHIVAHPHIFVVRFGQ